MNDLAMTVEVLPVAHGDCILVQCPVPGRTWRMLVDTGPDDSYPTVKKRLALLPLDGNGRRTIDVFVVSHIDHDHIGAAALLLGDQSLSLAIGDIWFNAPQRRPTRGVEEGESLATVLGARDVALPWNRAFDGKLAVVPADSKFLELAGKPDEPRVTLVSPGPKQLDSLFAAWDKELAKLRRKESDKAAPAAAVSRSFEALDIDALAAREGPPDRSLPNGSSIALLLEHRGASILLGADAYAGVVASALHAIAERRGIKGSVAIDAFKVSHHGSRGNVSEELLKAMRAKHFIFSTNNAIFNLPDDDAVAHVITQGGPGAQLWFNYATPRNIRWQLQSWQEHYQYAAHFPRDGETGVVLGLEGRATLAGDLPPSEVFERNSTTPSSKPRRA